MSYPEEALMRFTLTYDGEDLKSANTESRVREKQIIRAHFHKQLRRFWDNSNIFRNFDRATFPEAVKTADRYDRSDAQIPETGKPLEGFMYRRTIHGVVFIPLVTRRMEAQCHLSLRLGRPVGRKNIFRGGDLDRRISTLFDSLAVPKDESQVIKADCHESEYLCVLSDDELITGISIESYEILDFSGGKQEENYVDINLAVTIIPVTPMGILLLGTTGLLFG